MAAMDCVPNTTSVSRPLSRYNRLRCRLATLPKANTVGIWHRRRDSGDDEAPAVDKSYGDSEQ
jgi:hypothetical protein